MKMSEYIEMSVFQPIERENTKEQDKAEKTKKCVTFAEPVAGPSWMYEEFPDDFQTQANLNPTLVDGKEKKEELTSSDTGHLLIDIDDTNEDWNESFEENLLCQMCVCLEGFCIATHIVALLALVGGLWMLAALLYVYTGLNLTIVTYFYFVTGVAIALFAVGFLLVLCWTIYYRL